jgi:hypothetical protein
MRYAIGVLALSMSCWGTTLFSGSGTTETDNSANMPVAGMVSFDISAGQLTITITNTTSDPFFDSQNITAVSFQLSDSSLTGPSGTVTDTGASVVNKSGDTSSFIDSSINSGVVTPTTDNITWQVSNLATLAMNKLGAGNRTGGGNNVALGNTAFVVYAYGSQTNNINDGGGTTFAALHSIVGAPNGSGKYDTSTCSGTAPNPCNTGSPLVAPIGNYTTVDTSEFANQTLTFVISIPGLTTSDTVQTVYLGYGPDGPDKDDWLATSMVLSPEPQSLMLAFAGLALLGLMALRARAR